MEFEWDDAKAASNLRKHGVAFDEGRTVFQPGDPFIMFDPEHSQMERRYIGIGPSEKNRMLMVAFSCPRAGRIRLISVRKATRREVEVYAKAKAQAD
jgi:uncharacterized DUF497 family protein